MSKSLSKRDRQVLHPSQLSVDQREKVARDGLGDREERVRALAAGMLLGWFDLVGVTDDKPDFLQGALEFLKLFDPVGLGSDSIAADALRSVFLSRQRTLRKLVFPGKLPCLRWH